MSRIGQKIEQVFPDIAILKDQDSYSVFDGRNLPSFVKDFLLETSKNPQTLRYAPSALVSSAFAFSCKP